MDSKPSTIDEYIAAFPADVQEILEKIRALIRKEVPDAAETISYGVPTFKQNGSYVIYFGGYKNHVAVYPVPKSDTDLADAIADYQTGKGTVQFKLNKEIPYDLISRIVKAAVRDNSLRAAAKKKA